MRRRRERERRVRTEQQRKVDFVAVRVLQIQVPGVAEPDVVGAALDPRAVCGRGMHVLAADRVVAEGPELDSMLRRVP